MSSQPNIISDEPTGRADAARARIFEATCGDPEWLAVARIQHNIAHCQVWVPPSNAERWDAVQALEEIALNVELTYKVR